MIPTLPLYEQVQDFLQLLHLLLLWHPYCIPAIQISLTVRKISFLQLQVYFPTWNCKTTTLQKQSSNTCAAEGLLSGLALNKQQIYISNSSSKALINKQIEYIFEKHIRSHPSKLSSAITWQIKSGPKLTIKFMSLITDPVHYFCQSLKEGIEKATSATPFHVQVVSLTVIVKGQTLKDSKT